MALPPDTTAPETTIDSLTRESLASREVTITFSGSDTNTPVEELRYECALDGGLFESCSSPHVIQDLTDGTHTFEVVAIDLAENRDQSPATHEFTVEVASANTPTGSNVVIELPLPDVVNGNVSVTFSQVTATGVTSIAELGNPPPLPAGYAAGTDYDLSTTATYTGTVSVCYSYDLGSVEPPVRLLHWDGGAWVDITTSVTASRVCGATDSL